MQRRKRHLRLKSIVINIDGFQQVFDYNLREDMICSSAEKDEKIKSIKLMMNSRKMKNDIKIDTNFNFDLASQNRRNVSLTNILHDPSGGIVYDLSHYDPKDPKIDLVTDPCPIITENKKDLIHTDESNGDSLDLVNEKDMFNEMTLTNESFSLFNDCQYFVDDIGDGNYPNENSDYLKYYLF